MTHERTLTHNGIFLIENENENYYRTNESPIYSCTDTLNLMQTFFRFALSLAVLQEPVWKASVKFSFKLLPLVYVVRS